MRGEPTDPMGGVPLPPAAVGSSEINRLVEAAPEPVAGPPDDRRLRACEILLVISVAFGASLIYTAGILLYGHSPSVTSTSQWVYKVFHDCIAIGLLAYVLARRSKTFSDLGLTWRWSDLPWSFALFAAGAVVSYLVRLGFYFGNPDATGSSPNVGDLLFHSVSVATILSVFVNPVYEELIVRGYLITELRRFSRGVALPIAASVVLQATYHIYQGGPRATAAGAMFLIWSLYFVKTGRLTPIVLAHLYCDAGSLVWYQLKN
jgi:membrane protease YdiL (CAAX protease family)